jgi:DNA-binding Lrp family transcriptional regulator
MRAYILVHFAADADLSKARHALNRPGVAALDLVMGPYDAIVTCDVADMAELGQLAVNVRGCPGIRDTITCPTVEA